MQKTIKKMDRADFLKQVGTGFGAIMLMNCIQSCGSSEIPDPTPPPTSNKLDFSININDVGSGALKNKGGFYIDKDRSIIIARTLDDNWIAVSSKCTHQQVELTYRGNSNDFRCPLHGSEFTAKGAVQKGPAAASLSVYKTAFTVNTNMLRITE
jgi:cytochrome b6-f complex iron-sulfur subunit